MRTKCYTITFQTVELGYLYEGTFNDSGKIEDITEWRKHSSEELQKQAISAASNLYARSQSQDELMIFDTFEAAMEFARHDMTFYKYTHLTYSEYLPYLQAVVVELYVDSDALQQAKMNMAKPTHSIRNIFDTEWHEDQQAELNNTKRFTLKALPNGESAVPRNQDKQYPIRTLPNQLENYIIYQLWLKKTNPIPFNKLSATAQHQFESDKTIVEQVKHLFLEYHNPAFFSLHWRHHKSLALKLTDFLNKNPSLKEAYDFIFSERHDLIAKNKDLDLNGTFFKRMEAALTALRDAAHDELEVVKTAAIELKQ